MRILIYAHSDYGLTSSYQKFDVTRINTIYGITKLSVGLVEGRKDENLFLKFVKFFS